MSRPRRLRLRSGCQWGAKLYVVRGLPLSSRGPESWVKRGPAQGISSPTTTQTLNRLRNRRCRRSVLLKWPDLPNLLLLHRVQLASMTDRQKLAARISGGSSGTPRRFSSDPRRTSSAPIPLSLNQQPLWVHAQLAPDLPIYNEPVTLRRSGPLDLENLERSFTEIIRRHESWRTTFPTIDGEPMQVCTPPAATRLRVVDLRHLPPHDREAEARRLATDEARRPMDITRGPLVRATVMRLDEEEYRLHLTVHHLIHDGVSIITIFVPELLTLYQGFLSGTLRPSRYQSNTPIMRLGSGNGFRERR